ncbi:Hint domain-containing protein [Algicella marina]|uniref:Hedgehog/Intein (Hint) domain-containing protein n=1 Tax=Algicella marina TaxID=2683284 RepID=A0A6P1SZU3_9RHOB|nr:Hint domain-containing protein [Algicella marina]QHQ36008.1 hypothetical protein GO499_12910 [Algicella marina]
MPTVFFVDAAYITSAALGSPSQGDGSQHNGGSITFDPDSVLSHFEGSDDDNLFQDSDSNQLISDSGTSGFTVGQDFEAEYTVVVQDALGQQYTLYGLSVGTGFSNVVGFAFLGAPPPFGEELSVVSTSEGPSGTGSPEYDDLGTTICFTPGTWIETGGLARPIETLTSGDMVATLDHGLAPIAWAGATHLSGEELQQRPHLAPVLVKANSIGPGLPARDLVVSPHHRLLVAGWQAQTLFGEREVLCSAITLANSDTIRQITPKAGVTYHHICFDAHQIVTSNGLPSESLMPSSPVLDTMAAPARDELLELFPELRTSATGRFASTVRRTLSALETASLCGAA